jgi:hypothetical protein
MGNEQLSIVSNFCLQRNEWPDMASGPSFAAAFIQIGNVHRKSIRFVRTTSTVKSRLVVKNLKLAPLNGPMSAERHGPVHGAQIKSIVHEIN